MKRLEELLEALDGEIDVILADLDIQQSLLDALAKTLKTLRPFVTDAIWAQSGAAPAICEYEARYE